MSEAIWSSTAPVTNTIRSRSRREKMSKLRSPRFDCSMTMGTSALSGSGILSCMRLFLLFIVVLPLHRVKCARLQEDSWHAALFAERKAFRKSEPLLRPALDAFDASDVKFGRCGEGQIGQPPHFPPAPHHGVQDKAAHAVQRSDDHQASRPAGRGTAERKSVG